MTDKCMQCFCMHLINLVCDVILPLLEAPGLCELKEGGKEVRAGTAIFGNMHIKWSMYTEDLAVSFLPDCNETVLFCLSN